MDVEKNLIITQKVLEWDVTGIDSVEKQFDGNINAIVTGTLGIKGAVQGDAVALRGTVTAGTFGSFTTGTHPVELDVEQVTLTGDKEGNYMLPRHAPVVNGTIHGIDPLVTVPQPTVEATFNNAEQPLPLGAALFADSATGQALNGAGDKNVAYHYYSDDARQTEVLPRDAGTYYVTAVYTPGEEQQMGGYNGAQAQLTYIIHPKAITPSLAFAGGSHTLEWTGAELKPALTVQDGGVTLLPGTDYTVEYSGETTDAQESTPAATAAVTLRGNYELALGAANSLAYTIQRKPYDMSGVALEGKAFTFDGQPHGLAIPAAQLVLVDDVHSDALSASYTYALRGPDGAWGEPVGDRPTAAGTYQVTATVTTSHANRCFPRESATGGPEKYVLTATMTIGYDTQPTITFDLNGGTAGGSTGSVVWTNARLNTKLKDHEGGVPIPTKAGAVLLGWEKDGILYGLSGTEYVIGEQMITGSATYKAVWSGSVFGVTLTVPAGSAENSVAAATGFGSGAAQLGLPWEGWLKVADGYSIKGLTVTIGGYPYEGFTHSVDKSHLAIPAEAVTGPIAVYAATEAHDYVIHFDGNGGNASGVMADQDMKFNELTALAPNVFTRENCTFLGWSKSPTATAATYADQEMVTNVSYQAGGKVTLYAVWKANSDLPTSLQNGSFESPVNQKSFSQFYNYTQNTSSLWWKTTAADKMIELGSVKGGFASGSWNAYHTREASDGVQFAELNANLVSSLYQTVATNPGSTLYWGLDHRGRMGLDTMQLWIGAPADVNRALEQYKAGGNKINKVDAALLAKIAQVPAENAGRSTNITDDNKAWGSYTGEYSVPDSQIETMFAFVSVSAAGGNSCGNLLDNIYFSTVIPVRTVPVKVTTSAGGSVIIRHDGKTVADLPTSANVTTIAEELEKGKTLKLTAVPEEGYSFVGAIVNNTYQSAAELQNMSWTLENAAFRQERCGDAGAYGRHIHRQLHSGPGHGAGQHTGPDRAGKRGIHL